MIITPLQLSSYDIFKWRPLSGQFENQQTLLGGTGECFKEEVYCISRDYFICRLAHFNRRRLHSQIYGVLLIVNVLIIITELPFTLAFLHDGSIRSQSTCTIWNMINYSLFLASIILMAWTSIERYVFIYHERFMLRHIILLHYAPIIVTISYSIFFYVGAVLLYKCKPAYNVHLYVCGGACYQYQLELGLIDMIVNAMCSVITIFVVNLVLIVRHVMERCYMKRSVVPVGNNLQWVRIVMSFLLILFCL